MVKQQIFLNPNYNGKFTTTSTGYIFIKENSEDIVNIPKPVYLEDVSGNDEVMFLLSQGTLIVKGETPNSKKSLITDITDKGVKEKFTTKSVDENESLINDLIDEDNEVEK